MANIFGVLVSQHDIAALPTHVTVPLGMDMGWIDALLPAGHWPPGPARGPALRRVEVPRLPGGVVVRSSNPARCLPSGRISAWGRSATPPAPA